MKKILSYFIAAAFFLILTAGFATADVTFDDHFKDDTLRIDYYHTGDATTELITIDRCYRSKGWAGSVKNLLDPYNVGKYLVKVYDAGGKTLLFSRGYNSIFEEYQTTNEAAKGRKKTYEESVLIPFPRAKVVVAFESRDKSLKMQEVFRTTVDPEDVYIVSSHDDPAVEVIPLHNSGDRHKKVDVAILAEGYEKKDRDKFARDAKDLMEALFMVEPFLSMKNDFNVWGVFTASKESGCNEPGFGSFKNTAMGCGFDSLGSERYLLTEQNRTMRNVASAIPYDTLALLVNTGRYGGGGIYGLYATSISDNQWKYYVFVHELGHSFAAMADEYYTSKVEYNDFYPTSLEPLSPNITALLKGQELKWKSLVKAGTPVPTPWSKKEYDQNDKSYQATREKNHKILQEARRNHQPAEKIEALEKEGDRVSLERAAIADGILEKSPHRELVGAFEGAGYQAKGLYRPMVDCIMFTKGKKPFCTVCQDAIRKRIEFFCR